MKITNSHVRFWIQRKQGKLPKWAQSASEEERKISINDLINTQEPTPICTCTHNTLTILKSARKRGDLVVVLGKMAVDPGTIVRPEKRKAMCKKWFKRI